MVPGVVSIYNPPEGFKCMFVGELPPDTVCPREDMYQSDNTEPVKAGEIKKSPYLLSESELGPTVSPSLPNSHLNPILSTLVVSIETPYSVVEK
jgi:hypothetical protein